MNRNLFLFLVGFGLAGLFVAALTVLDVVMGSAL